MQNMNSANTQGTGRTNKIPGIDNPSQEKKKASIAAWIAIQIVSIWQFPNE